MSSERKNLIDVITEHGLRINYFAERLGVSSMTVRNWRVRGTTFEQEQIIRAEIRKLGLELLQTSENQDWELNRYEPKRRGRPLKATLGVGVEEG